MPNLLERTLVYKNIFKKIKSNEAIVTDHNNFYMLCSIPQL